MASSWLERDSQSTCRLHLQLFLPLRSRPKTFKLSLMLVFTATARPLLLWHTVEAIQAALLTHPSQVLQLVIPLVPTPTSAQPAPARMKRSYSQLCQSKNASTRTLAHHISLSLCQSTRSSSTRPSRPCHLTSLLLHLHSHHKHQTRKEKQQQTQL